MRSITTHPIVTTTALAVALLLGACGGGSGDTAAQADTNTSAAGSKVILTSSNYVTVTAEAAAAGLGSSDLSGFGAGSVSLMGVDARSGPRWAALGRAQVARALQALQTAPGPWLSGVTTTVTSGCMTFYFNDVSGNRQLDAGDTVNMSFASCQESDGTTVNGSLALSVRSASGDIGGAVYALDMDMTFGSLIVTDSTGTAQADGSLTLQSTRTATNVGRDRLSSASLRGISTVGSQRVTRMISDYLATIDWNGTETISTLSGTVSTNAVVGGAVATVSTTVPFQQRLSEAYPYTGTAVVSGANGGQARLTVQSSTSVQIALDADGDGTFEESTVKTWASIW